MKNETIANRISDAAHTTLLINERSARVSTLKLLFCDEIGKGYSQDNTDTIIDCTKILLQVLDI